MQTMISGISKAFVPPQGLYDQDGFLGDPDSDYPGLRSHHTGGQGEAKLATLYVATDIMSLMRLIWFVSLAPGS